VIGIDTNVLVGAHRRDSEWHPAARAAVTRLAEGAETWALPWPCLHEFLAIVTHPRIFRPPSTLRQAIDQIDAWLESPTVVVLSESEPHWKALKRQLIASKAVGPRVHDARVAALCLAHGVSRFWSADRDFSRFPELSVSNPLIDADT
jgi:uncharacterized protein